MKTKIKKAKKTKDLKHRIVGIAKWHITGPCIITGERVVLEFYGTRAQAEQVEIRHDSGLAV